MTGDDHQVFLEVDHGAQYHGSLLVYPRGSRGSSRVGDRVGSTGAIPSARPDPFLDPRYRVLPRPRLRTAQPHRSLAVPLCFCPPHRSYKRPLLSVSAPTPPVKSSGSALRASSLGAFEGVQHKATESLGPLSRPELKGTDVALYVRHPQPVGEELLNWAAWVALHATRRTYPSMRCAYWATDLVLSWA